MIATDGLQAMYSATNPKNFPDGGTKLRQQIHELEKEIAKRKDNNLFRLSIFFLVVNLYITIGILHTSELYWCGSC